MDMIFDQDFMSRLERLSLSSKKMKVGQNSGARRSPQKGHSVEFADFRSYAPGDDFRYVDWNSYARSEKLFVKLFMEEQDLLLNIFFDVSASMDFGEPSKARLARQLAGALAYLALTAYDRVAVVACADRIYNYLPPQRGRPALEKTWACLGQVYTTSDTSLNKALRDFGRYSRGAGVAVLISDLLSPHGFKEGLNYLQYLKQDIILLQILAPDEINPSMHGDWRLVDSETRASQELTISSGVLKLYRQKLQAFTEDTRDFCQRRGISFLPINSDELFEDVILRRLPQAGILK